MSQMPPDRNLFDKVAHWIAPSGQAQGVRVWLAQLFAIVGTLFAGLQLLLSTLEEANRVIAKLNDLLPYLVPILFAGGAITALYFMFSSSTSRRHRRWATGALALVLAAAVGWSAWSYTEARKPPKAVVVVVGDFDDQHATKGVDWGRRIHERVNSEVSRLGLGERVDIQRVFESFGSSDQARERGEELKATLVLWGWYDDAGVSPHFELLRSAEKYALDLAAPPQDLTDFDAYLQSGPQEMAYIVAVVLGLVRYAEADYLGAEALFSGAISAAPEGGTLLGLDAPYFYRANSRYFGYPIATRPMDGIVSDLEKAVATKPDFWQGHWNLALVLTAYCNPARALDESLTEVERVRELRPNDPKTYWLLGAVRSERGEWALAEAAYREATRLDAGYAEAFEMLGKTLERLEQNEEAETAYARALELRALDADAPGDDPAASRARLGIARFNLGDYAGAISDLQEAIRLRPDVADYHRFLGNALYWQGKDAGQGQSTQLSAAIAEYESARELAPDDSLLLTVLAGSYVEAGRETEATATYEAAVQAAPCDDEALFLLASRYDTLGRTADAETAFRRLVELNPAQSVGWHYLATAALQREEYAEAEADYRAALASAPDDTALLYGHASTLYFIGDYRQSEEVYRKLAGLLPEDSATLVGWADALAKLDRTDEAIGLYEKAVAIEPDTEYYWASLGLLYQSTKRWDGAARAFGRQAEIAPENAWAHASHGWALGQLGRVEEAILAYEQAVKFEPQQAGLWESLAIAYAAGKRADDAMAAADTTLRLNPDSVAGYLVRGGVHEERNERELARADYERALGLAGDNSALREMINTALARVQ